MTNKKENRIIIMPLIAILFIIGSVLFSIENFYIKKGYIIEAKLSCDPNRESCFIEECNTDDPRCLGIDSANSFKVARKKASVAAPLNTCQQLNQCEIIYCNEETLNNYGENCS